MPTPAGSAVVLSIASGAPASGTPSVGTVRDGLAAAYCAAQVDAFQDHRELRVVDLGPARGRLHGWKLERAALKAFVEHGPAGPIEEEQLHQVPALVDEQHEMTGE